MSYLDIKPINDDRLTCFERPLCAVSKWLDIEYKHLFLGGFTFSNNYVKTYNSVSDSYDMLLLLKTFTATTGINISVSPKISPEDFQQHVYNTLNKGLPVMVYIDSFYCPWYPSYQLSHIKHYILIVGINKKKREYYCLDRYADYDYIKVVPFADAAQGCGEYFSFDISSKHNISNQEYLEILHNNLLNVISGDYNIWDNIVLFKETLLTNINMVEEVSNVHTYKVASIYTWLKGISNSRAKLANSLSWYNKTYRDIFANDSIGLLEASYKKWWKIILLLIKALSTKSEKEYSEAAKTVDQILVFEKQIHKTLMEVSDVRSYL